jgi:hypothetical protein
MECRIADVNLTVRLDPDVSARLDAAVMEGYKAVPRRGLEVGGLLLGSIQGDGVLVDDFVPVESEHLHGPSYLLSDKDKTFLAAEIARVQAEAGSARVVGLYRSHTRPDFAPTAEDQALMTAHCPSDSSVFLLLKPQMGAPVSAAWFAAGRGLWDKPTEFSLPRGAATEPPRHSDVMRLRLTKVLEAAAEREAEILPPRPPPRTHRWIAPAAILLLSAAAGYGTAAWWTTKPRAALPNPLPMALRVTLDHGFLHLGWDRHSPSIRNAAAGIVWIEDGGNQRRLDLRPADLTEGSIQYWPKSSEVRFKLELLASQGMTESIRATGIPLVSEVHHPETGAPPPARSTANPPRKNSHDRKGGDRHRR